MVVEMGSGTYSAFTQHRPAQPLERGILTDSQPVDPLLLSLCHLVV